MMFIRRLGGSLFAGGLSGLAAFAIDQSLAFLTLGHTVALSLRFMVAYPASGMVVGGLIGTALLLGRIRWPTAEVLAAGVAALYALPIFERISSETPPLVARFSRFVPVPDVLLGAGPIVALRILFGLAAVAGFGLWIVLLKRITGSRSLAPPMWIASLTAAVGLAINRNVVYSSTSPPALAADAAILTGSLAAAYLLRAAGPRRTLAAAAGLLLATATVATFLHSVPIGEVDEASEDTRPHLVLVVIDTLRLDVFDSVVRETEEGRAFERALGGAAWFSNAIATAPWTAPSVASILTGLYPEEHGFVANRDESIRFLNRMSETVPTLAEHLSHLGYWTEGIGTNTVIHPRSGVGRGFQRYQMLFGATAKLPLLTALYKFNLLSAEVYQPAGAVRRELVRRLRVIAPSRRPAFLWLHLTDPHEPLRRHWWSLSAEPATVGLPKSQRLYRDEVRYTLRHLTGIFDLLRSHGLWESAAVMVVSDHGEMFPSDGHDIGVTDRRRGQPKIYGHGHTLYGELMRVPLIIRPPGGLRSKRSIDVLTSLVDLHDTAIDLLGIDAPRIGGDRVSLAPWLEAESPAVPPAAREVALFNSTFHAPEQRGIRTASVKLIEYLDGSRPRELYQIVSDPEEQHDLAVVEPKRLEEAVDQLESLWSRLVEPPESPEMPIDPETLKRLRALGYVD